MNAPETKAPTTEERLDALQKRVEALEGRQDEGDPVEAAWLRFRAGVREKESTR